jgi:hypothetical protein
VFLELREATDVCGWLLSMESLRPYLRVVEVIVVATAVVGSFILSAFFAIESLAGGAG